MSLPDLSLVTTTLLRLLKLRVDAGWAGLFPNPPPPPAITYSGLSSEKLTSDNALGLFLYHAVEDASFRNQAPIYQDHPPVRFTPMGLQLHYQMVAHSADLGDPESAVIRSQRLFGLALKAFHDYPVIHRETQIGGALVFPLALQGTDNVFRITLKNMPPAEATNFWSAGTQAVRLAAYYEVSVAFLEPDRPQLRAGRVLRYGVQVFVNGAPRLDASHATVLFRLPGETADRTAKLQPGEAAVGEKISFEGTDLSGDATTLLINRAAWIEAEEVGAEWGVVAGPDAIYATVQSTAGSREVVPGVYSAAAKVTRNRPQPDGSVKAVRQTSNQVPFTVAPSITSPAHDAIGAAAGPESILTIAGGVFQHPDVLPENVQVTVGSEPVPIKAGATLNPGHFEITSATQIRVRFPIAGLVSGAVLPLRVIVNGAENAPRWVRVP